jgi:hypothetical protein
MVWYRALSGCRALQIGAVGALGAHHRGQLVFTLKSMKQRSESTDRKK